MNVCHENHQENNDNLVKFELRFFSTEFRLVSHKLEESLLEYYSRNQEWKSQ